MKRILLSLITIAAVALVAFGASQAFFSDTETSTGNTFVAGALDLKIDNDSYAIDCNVEGSQSCTGTLVASADTSWDLTDLSEERFFNFYDLKPGDFGEDTISVHVDNDAWLCMDWRTETTPENGVLDPETDAGDRADDGAQDGELQDYVRFIWWVDDGDNVLETDEYADGKGVLFSGTLAEMNELSVALADSSTESVTDGEPIPATTEENLFYIGKAWCFGELEPNPVADNGGDNPTVDPGVLCNGENPAEVPDLHNIAQTDSVHGTMSFYAEQARHNEDFLCNEPD